MKTRTFLFFALLIMMPALSYGQLGRLIKNTASRAAGAVGRATSKEANKEIDSAAQVKADRIVTNAADSMKKNNQTNPSEGQTNKGQGMNLGGLLGGKVDVKYNDEYKFNSRMVMQMELYDKKEPTKMDYNIYFSSTNPSMAMEMMSLSPSPSEGKSAPASSQIVMVMDGENKCFLMLMEDSKMGMISPVPDENSVKTQNAGKPGETVTPPSITKTGNSKVIAGYKCDEYLVKETDNKKYSKMWFTKEAVINVDKRAWSKAGMPTAYGYSAFEGGVIMGFESYDETGKLTAKSEVKEVDKNYSHMVTAKGYSLMKMNFNQMQGQKK